jgi:hypothetical protein
VPITTKGESSNTTNGEVYSIPHYVKKFVSDVVMINTLVTAILACCVLKRMAEKASRGKDMILFDAFTEHAR